MIDDGNKAEDILRFLLGEGHLLGLTQACGEQERLAHSGSSLVSIELLTVSAVV